MTGPRMLYRLSPPGTVSWCAAPGDAVSRAPAELDALPWAPAERAFGADLLRIAVRHGVASPAGLVLDARHTVDLGRADGLRSDQLAIDDAQAGLRESVAMRLIEQAYPGSGELAAQLDEKLRKAAENTAREAEAQLAEVLAAPVRPALAEHWRRLGGRYPD
ncbi:MULTISPECIES: hypothetical protein [unclassified Amycolatopsis]|uniref:hypothetical protein n=1 Tax=unclassified Amycolatopsis TaxID=2618356 RepID=UPI001FF1B409|nr:MULTISPECIES: hypothetical protein [unclassified Amycolatopsis]UOZ05100.1 hypothetical protein MUY22_40745 [Amycolatopsis sp. WQ 127309]WSJ80671.1 hypothetical protein OG439_17250 [Amycolatopsis sp. NBC_01307]WSK75891.1 hypothetical protein OG570_31540 [Amycolatopsis sp. NBC_01286]